MLHSSRKRADPPAGDVVELDRLQHLADLPGDIFPLLPALHPGSHVLQRRHVPHESRHAEIGVHPRILRHEAELFAESDSHLKDVFGLIFPLLKEDLARVCLEVVGDDVYQGGFPRPVRPQQRVYPGGQLGGKMLKSLVRSVRS